METALRLGYRLFDLAREYKNEADLALLFEKTRGDDTFAMRDEVFIISKVWPTDLGFIPTYEALYDSLHQLGVNYIDMYLLHWPSCDPSVTWMHCESTVDPLVPQNCHNSPRARHNSPRNRNSRALGKSLGMLSRKPMPRVC